jgi:hypothetical protein
LTSKEIIRKCIAFDKPERIGMDFRRPFTQDLSWILAADLVNPMKIGKWGRDPELVKELPWFEGELMRDVFGVIYGRLDGAGSGEPLKGPLTDSLDRLDSLVLPTIDREATDARLSRYAGSDKYLLGILESAPFSTMRGIRGLDNHLADTILETESVRELNARLEKLSFEVIRIAGAHGFDGICVYEDWGTQTALLMNPDSWRTLYKPFYKRLSDAIHGSGMAFFVHSCGAIYDIIGDFVEIGVDAFNFDQPELHGIERLAADFGGKVNFWCPVDIQKTLPTGNRELIEAKAKDMLRLFGGYDGGFIAKDYPQYDVIGIKDEWADWAREIWLSAKYG